METLKLRIAGMKPAFTLLYLSLMGFFSIFSAQRYLGLAFEPLDCLSFMGIIFGVYTLNRFTDTAEDFTNDIGRLLFFQRKKTFLYLAVAVLAASFGSLECVGRLNWMHILLLAMGFGYSYRLIPWYFPKRGFCLLRIKEMTFVKNLAVSLLWSSSVFVVPILYSGASSFDKIMVCLLSVGLFVSTLNNTLFDDIMDEPGDRVAGIKTLPTLWGRRNAGILLLVLDVTWLICVAAIWLASRIDFRHAAFLGFLGLYPSVYMGLYARKLAPESVIDFLSESDLLLFALGLFLLTIG